MHQEVTFYSEGSEIKGHLYLPQKNETDPPFPAVVMCHGFAGVKEMLLPPFAEGFANAGYAVLTFDYRGFGESGGTPGRLVAQDQIADIRNAVTFAAATPEIDGNRIGLWGTSYGGANAIVAAERDHRVRCLVVQLTFGDGERVILGGKSEAEQTKIRETVNKIWVKEVVSNKPMMLGVNRFLTDEQSQVFYKEMVERFPALKVKIPFSTMRETIEHKPEKVVGKVGAPLLIVAAENDRVNPAQESTRLYELAKEPKSLFVIPGATHYDVYTGPHFEKAFQKEKEWLDTHLAAL